MKIQIENYKGVGKLDYELTDGKINYLFGISGSGKSSIASALVDENPSNHLKIGSDVSSLKILVENELPDINSFKVYDMNYLDNILLTKQNKTDIYSILFGNNGEIELCRENYSKAINDLLKVKDQILSKLADIHTLLNDLKISYKNSGGYSATCLVEKMAKNYESISGIRNIKKYSAAEIKWIADGTKMTAFADEKCPFCESKLSRNRIDKIRSILIFDAKTYEKINSKSSIFSNLGIPEPIWDKKRELIKFNKKIKDYFDTKGELEKLNAFIDLTKKTNFDDFTISIEKPSIKFKKIIS